MLHALNNLHDALPAWGRGCRALGPPIPGGALLRSTAPHDLRPHPTRASRRWRARVRLRRTSPSPTPANAALRPYRRSSGTVPATRPFASGAAPLGTAWVTGVTLRRRRSGDGADRCQYLCWWLGGVRMLIWCAGGGSTSARPRARVLSRGGSAAAARPLGRHPPDRSACPPASDPPQLHSISLTLRADADYSCCAVTCSV